MHELVKLENIMTAKITRTLLDQHPLAIYTIDKVLLLKELFKASPMIMPMLAPTLAPMVAKSPKAPKHVSPPIPESMSRNGELFDQTVVDDNNVVRFNDERWTVVIFVLLPIWLG
uniref:Uncharacterized protein n=1 Tax=Nelumbo nucifera TaxID=4432 RepID=A0A822YMJ2_NELNU|nr:TPA_asm: hypothetical protein HUJ06_011642 [Nelumbo nucifera]